MYPYYMGSKEESKVKNILARQMKKGQVNWFDYGVQMAQQFYGLSGEETWKLC